VNLTGVAHGDVRRGDALVEARRWRPTRTVDASLRVLASLDHDVTRRGAYAAYLGAGEYPVAVRLLGDISSVAPGDEAFVRLHLPVALPLLPGDRYVLREHGRGETVGGGEVLDVAPVLSAARARPSRDVDRVVAERGWVDAAELEAITGERRHPTVGRWVTSPESLASTVDDVRTMVDGAGALGLDVAALDDRQRAVLATLDDVAVDAGRARRRDAAAEALAGHPFLAELEASPVAPPDPVAAGVDRGELRELVRRGLVVERDGIWFAPAAIDDAARVVARLLRQTPEGVTASAVREALGTTRKYALPLLAVLDTTGVTRRRGDVRIGGPRLPPVDRLD
jgi:selenocysteine-specific elongation factor